MALIQWDERLSVNMAEIDKQHQQLVSIINDLSNAMTQGKGNDVLGNLLKKLISCAATHFKEEEKYFDLYRYPETASHKKEHLAFVHTVTDFKNGFEKGTLTISIILMTFLSEWLKIHITKTDKKYSHFFKGKGLK